MPAVSELQKFESKKTIFGQAFRLNHLYSLTPAAFLAFYPQFSSFSQGVVLPEYLRQANARFSDFGEDAEEARRLFVAHKLTLYSASTPPEGVTPTPAVLATAGRRAMQEMASKKVGDICSAYSWFSLTIALFHCDMEKCGYPQKFQIPKIE